MLQLYEKISALEKSQSKQASDDLFSNNNKGSRKTIESLAMNTANLKLLSSKVSNLENQFQQLVKHVNTRSKYSPRNMINGAYRTHNSKTRLREKPYNVRRYNDDSTNNPQISDPCYPDDDYFMNDEDKLDMK